MGGSSLTWNHRSASACNLSRRASIPLAIVYDTTIMIHYEAAHMGAGRYTFWPLQFHEQERLRPSVLLPFNPLSLTLLGDRNRLTTSMASSTPTTGPSVPPSGSGGSRSGTGGSGGGSSLPTVSAARMKTAASANFTMPPGTSLEMLTGQNWTTWSGTLSAILQLNDIDCILVYDHNPTGVDAEDWTTVQKKAKAYLQLYSQPDVFSTVASDVDFPTFKEKFDRLKETYGGVGSTAVFNLWIELTQARLDDSSPLAPQLAKLNEARVKLSNASMGVSDIQYCLILLNALPKSYEVVASTLLASGPATALKFSEITARILNEEGRKSGPSSSLNALSAPVKSGKKKKKDHADLTCHYCKKKGHIQPDCRKKKKDDAEKKKKEEEGGAESSKKAANSHVLVPTTASIEEVDDNELSVGLYAAERARWMMDSGATHHMSPFRSDFVDYSLCKGTVRLGDKSTVDQVGMGSIVFKTSQGTQITLTNVLHIPLIKTRFISTRALVQKGATVIFDQGSFKVVVNRRCIGTGYLEHNLYWLDASIPSLNVHTQNATPSLHLWHQRMGHMSHMALKAHGPAATTGMDFDAAAMSIPDACHGCETGKSARKPFSGSSRKTARILEIVHSDLAGPMQTRSIQGSSYIATFLDDYSRHAVVHFLRTKDQFVDALKQFLAWSETQTDEKLRALHSDRGGEYLAGSVTKILEEKGIERHLTMPGSPQQNGKAERFNRTVMDKALAMLHAAGLSSGFWECAVQTATHIYNRSPTRMLSWRTPYELWHRGQVPDVSHLRTFGCMVYMHVPGDKRRKLDAKAIETVLVGYEPGSKGYRLWDKHTHSLKMSRDVTFDESVFPFRQGDKPPPVPSTPAPYVAQPPFIPSPAPAVPNPPALPQLPAVPTTPAAPSAPAVPNPPAASSVQPEARPPSRASSTDSEASVSDLLRPPSEQPSLRPQTPRPRTPSPPSTLTSLPPTPEQPRGSPSAPPRRSTRVSVPNPRYCGGGDEVPRRGRRLGHAELLAAAHVGQEPVTYAEAMRSDEADEWHRACEYEMAALAKNETWSLVELPPGRKAVKSKWVFKLKVDGRYRARLVAKGFTQIPGIDFDETFSPVARFESLRLLLALAALEDWNIHQMDVKSAFLNGVLEEEIYMEQPTGFIVSGQEAKVCRLRKAIYGLKQASRAWNLQFHGVLVGLGFQRTSSDAGVYVGHQHGGDGVLILILYVDDTTIMGQSLERIKAVKEELSARYEMSDLGEIQSYLGIRIVRDRANRRIEIDQSGYITRILERFEMADAKPHKTPLPSGAEVHLVKYNGTASQSDIRHYQSLIGSLLYVQIGTRPDISFAVSRLAQYAANPSPQHLKLAQHVMGYLAGTRDMRIRYDGDRGEGLHGYTDSSLGDQTDDRHSTSGYIFLLGDGAISWSSRKQKTVAQNTTEAEYMAMADAANQAAWYRSFLEELGYTVDDPIPLHGDNKGAIDLALNPVTGRRSKHIEIRHHVVREYVEREVIKLVRTPTAEMLADGFTKPLARRSLLVHNEDMGLFGGLSDQGEMLE